MIQEEQGQIGAREFTAMLIIVLGSKMTDMSPTIIFQETKNAGWMVPLISGLMFMGLFLLLVKTINQYPGKGLVEITLELFGKKLGVFIVGTLFLVAVTALIVDSRSHVDTIGTMYFPQTPIIVIYFVFLGTSYFIARRGLSTIGIVSWLVLPYLIATVIALLLFVYKELHLLRVFPIFGPGIDVIAKESVLKLSLYSDTLFFTLFIPFLAGTKYSKNATIGTIFSISQITIFMIVFVALFDVIGVQRLMYPFHGTTRYVSIGQYFTNTETFYMAMWLVGVILKFSIYLFITTMLFSKLLNIRQIRPLLLPFTSITILVGILPENPIENVMILRENMLHITSFYLITIIITMSVLAMVKGGKRN